MVKDFAANQGSALRGLAALAAGLATVAAVIAIIASALLAFAGLALRARRTAQAARRSDGVIEARHLGGHHWVAYGWNERS